MIIIDLFSRRFAARNLNVRNDFEDEKKRTAFLQTDHADIAA